MKQNPLENFTTKELEDELGRRKNISKDLKLTLWSKTAVSEKGVRPKDLFVIAFRNPSGDGWAFGVALKKKWAKRKFLSDDYEEYSDWSSILPGNFGEASENCYEYYDGTFQDAVDLLKRCGFSIIKCDWETGIEEPI